MLTFSEYLKTKLLQESYHNFLPNDTEKKNAHKQEVFDLVSKAYESQGGIHGNGFRSPDGMVKNIHMWKLHKKDGKVQAAALYKDKGTGEGRKAVVFASTGTPESKKALAGIMVNDLKQKRSHVELSGKALSFHKKHLDLAPHLHTYEEAKVYHERNGDKVSRPDADDPEVLLHPELKDHFYRREIGSELHTKVMLGSLGNTITNK